MPCLFAMVLLAIWFIATPALADDDDGDTSLDDIPHVTMVGTAQVEVAPDLATITLGVTIEKPTAAAAADADARAAQGLVDAARARGVAPADIATQSLTLAQTFDDMRDAQGRVTGRKPRGFSADDTIAIKVRDLGKAGALAEALIGAGANRFDGIGFSVEHPGPIVARLTGEAVKDARARAQQAADAAGTKIGRVLQIEQPGGGEPSPPVFAARMKFAAAPAMPVEPGTTTLSSSVEVTWALDAN